MCVYARAIKYTMASIPLSHYPKAEVFLPFKKTSTNFRGYLSNVTQTLCRLEESVFLSFVSFQNVSIFEGIVTIEALRIII